MWMQTSIQRRSLVLQARVRRAWLNPAVAQLDAPEATPQIDLLRELFEVCYVQASGRGDDMERKQRAEVEEILTFFGASCGSRLRHACPPGCCDPESVVPAADRGKSVERAFGLVKRFVSPCLSEPAANKYTKVDPVMRKLALAANFFGLLRRAFARKFKEEGGAEADHSDISVDAALRSMPQRMRPATGGSWHT